MEIEIKNPDAVISICQTILNSEVSKLTQQIESLNTSLTSFNSSWESTGRDKESYIASLEKESAALINLKSVIIQVCNALMEYANANKQISSRSISGGGGVSKYYSTDGKYKSPVFSPQATDAGKAISGLTTNNQKYQIVDTVTGPGQITQQEYDRLVSVVAMESGSENPEEMLGIATTALNRYEGSDKQGTTLYKILTQKNQFANGAKFRQGGEFYNTDWGQQKIAAARQAVDDALNGYRNLGPEFKWYAAYNGVTRFRDQYKKPN